MTLGYTRTVTHSNQRLKHAGSHELGLLGSVKRVVLHILLLDLQVIVFEVSSLLKNPSFFF